MLTTRICLPDGREISSGVGTSLAIQECTITECVNSENELTPGSTCCACIELKIIAPSGDLNIAAGTEFTVYKEHGKTSTPVGAFVAEKPTQASANLYKVTAYDRVSRLDKDLSSWLKSLEGWPYRLATFAKMVCEACGLELTTTDFPNGDFSVNQFYKSGVTGRQLMRWIGEIACRFCRANAAGQIELAWYTDSGVTVQATGDRYYFAKALTYEDFTVAPVDAVQIRVTDSAEGALWPATAAENPYIITGNLILTSRVTEELLPVLQTIRGELAKVSYTPCKVSLPASLDIRAGHIVNIVDRNAKKIVACVMTKTQTGQRDTLECTGSASRNCPTALNNRSQQQMMATQELYAASAASAAVKAQTQQDIFRKLTNNGAVQGFFIKDDTLYINAEFVQILNLVAELITAGRMKSADGLTYFDLDTAELAAVNGSGVKISIKDGRLVLVTSDGIEMLVVGHNDSNATFINFGALGASAPRISVQNGQMSLQTIDFDDTNTLGQSTMRDYKVGWKNVNGEKVLVALT